MPDPTDYTGNSKKAKATPTTAVDVPDKKVVKVVTGDVGQKKPGLGAKFKSVFLGADLKGVATYAWKDVLVPEIRNMIFDGGRAAWSQFIYGDNGRRAQSRTDYRSASRSYSYRNDDRITRMSDPRDRGPLPRDDNYRGARATGRIDPHDRLFTDKGDAERVLETFKDILDQYEFVSHFDFLALIGREDEAQQIDHKWGWDYLGNIAIVHQRDGWVIDFPPMKEII